MFGISSLRLNVLFSGFLRNTTLISLVLSTCALSAGYATADTSPADNENSISADASSIAETRRLREISSIVNAIDRGHSQGMEAKITRHLKRYPDDATAYGQQSRLIMRAGYVADDSLIGFHFSNDADRRAVQALQTAVELAPDNMVELSRLGYLHAIQGRYKDAEKVFAQVRQSNTMPLWHNYNEAILAIGLEQYSKAATLLNVSNSKRPPPKSEPSVWTMYKSAWKLRKALALKYPDTDPVTAVREGKIRRISIDNVYDEAIQTSASGKPKLVVLSSSDDGCPFCATDLAGLGQVVDELDEEYHLVYASVEPWNDIEEYPILLRAFYLQGLPSHFIVHNGRYFGTTKGAFNHDKLPVYKRVGSEILEGTRKSNIIASYDTLLMQDIKLRMRAHLKKQTRFSAAAIAVDGRTWTSGTARGSSTQAEANAQAILRCQENVKSRNMNASCQPFVD